jgi:NAD(P)-dependent dehydrogenase (short-subunit alcohol dehydrogenase family)
MSKVIVITGAGSGLGRNMAIEFAEDGDSVVLLGRTLAKLEVVTERIGERSMAVSCDIGSPDSVRAAFAAIAQRHPKVDVLINNAGLFVPSLIAEASDELILQSIATNLTGPILCARAALGMMGFGGHIINVTSESVEMPFALLALYQSSKAGLERLTAALHAELEPRGIRASFVRAGSMSGEGAQGTNWTPEAAVAFFQECQANGIDLTKHPLSQYRSASRLVRALIDLPADLHAVGLTLHARQSGEPGPVPPLESFG